MATHIDPTKHGEIARVRPEEFEARASAILHDANAGVQTAILDASGNVRAVVGLNGRRYLPSADPDPLEEALLDALEAVKGERRR